MDDRLTRMEITTRHPEHYTLHNSHDGTTWRIEDGRWVAAGGATTPRPPGCCGKCPPLARGGYDCTCEGNPRCQRGGEAVSAAARAGEAEGWCTDPSCARDAHDHSRRDGYYGD